MDCGGGAKAWNSCCYSFHTAIFTYTDPIEPGVPAKIAS